MSDAVTRVATGGESDRERVATRLAPSSPSVPSSPRAPSSPPVGATMELPAPRKAASTTLRNATGERALSVRSPARRSRAPLVVVGVALVSAIAVFIVLRGNLAGDRRGDPDPAAVELPAAQGPPAAAATQEAPRAPGPIARPAPSATTATATATGQPQEDAPAPKVGAEAMTPPETAAAGPAAAAATRKATAKSARRGGPKGTRTKKEAPAASAGATTTTAPPAEAPRTTGPNGSPLIAP